jgi:Txe/YoeB family toxin of Txe-Axe toxin-antitoxin module
LGWFQRQRQAAAAQAVLAGCWSRILQEHRQVYRVSNYRIDFLQARYRYE